MYYESSFHIIVRFCLSSNRIFFRPRFSFLFLFLLALPFSIIELFRVVWYLIDYGVLHILLDTHCGYCSVWCKTNARPSLTANRRIIWTREHWSIVIIHLSQYVNKLLSRKWSFLYDEVLRRLFWGKTMTNQPGIMKNQPGTIKARENQPGTVKTMKTHL